MGKSIAEAMNWEDVSDVDSFKRLKTQKAKKDKKMNFKVTDIDKMNSAAIIWHLVRKHKFELSVTLNVALFAMWSNAAPVILSVLRG